MTHKLKYPPEKFGTLLGYSTGDVAIYSSHYPSIDPAEYPDRENFAHYIDDIYMGYKWQCVEFARRWLYINRGYVFGDVAMAYDIFKLDHVIVTESGKKLPLHAFHNGGRRRPQPGSMLIWAEGGEFDVTGHVAIITEVADDVLRIAEQNLEHALLPAGQNWTRELAITRTTEGGYFVNCEFTDSSILGWVMQTADDSYAIEHPETCSSLFNLNCGFANQQNQHLREWVDTTNKAGIAFVKAMQGHQLTITDNTNEHYRYFRLSESAATELVRATNELHLMFIHATQAVLQDDNLLSRFNIPEILWPRLRNSWDKRKDQLITGRFDFCVSDRGVKVYEYNADSASCYLEAGKIQGDWSRHFGIVEGRDAGEELTQALVSAWSISNVNGVLHIMQDYDVEESYHAQYILSTAEAAGIPCKVIKGVEGLSWGKNGEVLDPDGDPIKVVWKTWAWETALDQIRAECEEDDQPLKPGAKPRLVDVLLRPEVMVYEPLWTLVMSNKAILPILWQLFPQHPYLLNSQYSLTEDFESRGYVVKPIAGRCGFNISLYDKNDNLLKETSGRFDSQDQIYQELWKLPEIDGYKTQVCTFAVKGKYAAACVRVDKSLIITTHSDLLPLRIIDDDVL